MYDTRSRYFGTESLYLRLRSVLLVGYPFAQAATDGHATGVMFSHGTDYDFPAPGLESSIIP